MKTMFGRASGRGRQIDQPDDVGVLRRGLQFGEGEAADPAEDYPRLGANRLDGGGHIWRERPIVAGLRLPGRSFDREQRRARGRSRIDGVAAHLRGKGVGGVHQHVDTLVPQIADEPFDAAEPAASCRDRLSARRRGPPGERQRGLETPSAASSLASALASVEPPRRRTRMARADDEVTGSMAASNATPARWLSIVGLGESGREGLSPAANKLIDGAALLVGGARHLALIGAARGETLEWKKPFRDTVARILERRGRAGLRFGVGRSVLVRGGRGARRIC